LGLASEADYQRRRGHWIKKLQDMQMALHQMIPQLHTMYKERVQML